MLETFRGIVLRTVKYGDTSLVVDLYTREYGRKSFTTSSARIKRSVCGVSFWQPMSMLEMTADIRQASSRLPRLADVRSYRCYSDLPYSPVKSTLALFLAEFLCRSKFSLSRTDDRSGSPLKISSVWNLEIPGSENPPCHPPNSGR